MSPWRTGDGDGTVRGSHRANRRVTGPPHHRWTATRLVRGTRGLVASRYKNFRRRTGCRLHVDALGQVLTDDGVAVDTSDGIVEDLEPGVDGFALRRDTVRVRAGEDA